MIESKKSNLLTLQRDHEKGFRSGEDSLSFERILKLCWYWWFWWWWWWWWWWFEIKVSFGAFFLRPLLIKDKDDLIIFQVTAKLFHSIEKLPCASLTMTWRKPWRTRCIEYAGQAQQSRPSGKFLKEIVRTVLLSGSAFCGPEKYDIGERVKRDVPNIHILDILRYHDEPIEWCFLGFGLNWEWV